MSSQVDDAKIKKKRMGWNESSEAALLDMWPSKLDGLRGQRKNGHIYAEMSDELSQQGFSCSPRDIQVKLQNFTQRYRREKAAMGVSGGSPSTWCHYEVVHKIIGGCKANLFTELTLDSIDDVSNGSTLPSPGASLSPSPPISQYSPSPESSTSEPVKKRRKFDFRDIVLQKFDNISIEITEHLKKSEENEKKLIIIEQKKSETLEKIAADNKELNKALISFLNKN